MLGGLSLFLLSGGGTASAGYDHLGSPVDPIFSHAVLKIQRAFRKFLASHFKENKIEEHLETKEQVLPVQHYYEPNGVTAEGSTLQRHLTLLDETKVDHVISYISLVTEENPMGFSTDTDPLLKLALQPLKPDEHRVIHGHLEKEGLDAYLQSPSTPVPLLVENGALFRAYAFVLDRGEGSLEAISNPFGEEWSKTESSFLYLIPSFTSGAIEKIKTYPLKTHEHWRLSFIQITPIEDLDPHTIRDFRFLMGKKLNHPHHPGPDQELQKFTAALVEYYRKWEVAQHGTQPCMLEFVRRTGLANCAMNAVAVAEQDHDVHLAALHCVGLIAVGHRTAGDQIDLTHSNHAWNLFYRNKPYPALVSIDLSPPVVSLDPTHSDYPRTFAMVNAINSFELAEPRSLEKFSFLANDEGAFQAEVQRAIKMILKNNLQTLYPFAEQLTEKVTLKKFVLVVLLLDHWILHQKDMPERVERVLKRMVSRFPDTEAQLKFLKRVSQMGLYELLESLLALEEFKFVSESEKTVLQQKQGSTFSVKIATSWFSDDSAKVATHESCP